MLLSSWVVCIHHPFYTNNTRTPFLCQVVGFHCVKIDSKQGRTRPIPAARHHRRLLAMERPNLTQRIRQMVTRTRTQRTSHPPNHLGTPQQPTNTSGNATRPPMPKPTLLQSNTHGNRHTQRKHQTTRPRRTPQNPLPQRTRIQRNQHTH